MAKFIGTRLRRIGWQSQFNKCETDPQLPLRVIDEIIIFYNKSDDADDDDYMFKGCVVGKSLSGIRCIFNLEEAEEHGWWILHVEDDARYIKLKREISRAKNLVIEKIERCKALGLPTGMKYEAVVFKKTLKWTIGG